MGDNVVVTPRGDDPLDSASDDLLDERFVYVKELDSDLLFYISVMVPQVNLRRLDGLVPEVVVPSDFQARLFFACKAETSHQLGLLQKCSTIILSTNSQDSANVFEQQKYIFVSSETPSSKSISATRKPANPSAKHHFTTVCQLAHLFTIHHNPLTHSGTVNPYTVADVDEWPLKWSANGTTLNASSVTKLDDALRKMDFKMHLGRSPAV
ncbi:hypothetical protein V9T40_006944 [Parthenolecanium corni]|uniref:Uncharacterized protein n=1 Tax=Parthenolecanium corni TaxID=536013 RepID=A0AAN9TXN6_9HEMI